VCKSEGERVTDFLGRRLALEPVPMLRRISGVIPKAEPLRAAKWLRRMRLVALRDFKVKVGYPDDLKTLAVCGKILSYCMRRGKCTLRVDANGGWTLSEAVSKIGELKRCGVAAIEQPLAKGREKEMADLQKIADIPLMPDESLVTLDDAELALAEGWAQMFNIRISKNGGLVAALALANLARKRGIGFQLGCMVGETGILSAAGRVFLGLTGEDVRWAEGSYGRFLLTSDIVRERVTIGYAGRVRPLLGPGLGVTVDESKVERYAITMARLDF
ncbi:MAG: enolase C-terminal domain-like protein, partial [Planctomycetia bacterium]|nr:enolase C-terminal domain-like protein [Planctomycetia bacterium]